MLECLLLKDLAQVTVEQDDVVQNHEEENRTKCAKNALTGRLQPCIMQLWRGFMLLARHDFLQAKGRCLKA